MSGCRTCNTNHLRHLPGLLLLHIGMLLLLLLLLLLHRRLPLLLDCKTRKASIISMVGTSSSHCKVQSHLSIIAINTAR